MRFLPVALAGLVLAGCASTTGEGDTIQPTGSRPTPPSQTSTASAPAAQVPEILKFTATTVDGKPFDGASVAGKPTVFWFWAAWCPKCKGDAAQVRDLAKLMAGRVNVVGVAGLGSGEQGMKNFVDGYQLTAFPQIADDSGDVWKRFKVPSQHYYVVLDASGKEIHRGPLTVAQLAEKLG